jgi:hypothetical protein
MLTGHAPDQETADALVSAFVGATGALPEAATVTLAEGMPSLSWASDISGLLEISAGLQRWELDVSDQGARFSGLARDTASLASVNTALQGWQAEAGLSLDQTFQAGPEILSASALSNTLDEMRTCGPLSVEGDQFALGQAVPIKGYLATPTDATDIQNALQALVGSRSVEMDHSVLNPDLCAIRDILPTTQFGAMSVSLGRGANNAPNLTGVYTTGENPVVDILIPADQTDAFLWVMVVDNTGKVFNVLPNVNEAEQRISQLGVIEGGVRRVRVLHPRSVLEENPQKLVVEITEGDYGKSEIVAVLSKKPLFDIRRPRDESTTSAKEALTQALITSEYDLISITTRIIEARR